MTSNRRRGLSSDRLGAAARLLFGTWVTICATAALFPVLVLLMVSVAPGTALFGERPALIVTAPTFRFCGLSSKAVTSGHPWSRASPSPA